MSYFDMHKNTHSKIIIALEYFYAHKILMARPRKKITKQRVTITISPALLEAAQSYAYEAGESLSGLIERLLFEVLHGASSPAERLGVVGSIAAHQQGGTIGNIKVTVSPPNKTKQ